MSLICLAGGKESGFESHSLFAKCCHELPCEFEWDKFERRVTECVHNARNGGGEPGFGRRSSSVGVVLELAALMGYFILTCLCCSWDEAFYLLMACHSACLQGCLGRSLRSLHNVVLYHVDVLKGLWPQGKLEHPLFICRIAQLCSVIGGRWGLPSAWLSWKTTQCIVKE